jgi:hypothetical protein
MKLIDEWKKAHRYWSVQIAAVAAALMGAWEILPSDLRASMPHVQKVAAAMFIIVAASRYFAQPKIEKKP